MPRFILLSNPYGFLKMTYMRLDDHNVGLHIDYSTYKYLIMSLNPLHYLIILKPAFKRFMPLSYPLDSLKITYIRLDNCPV